MTPKKLFRQSYANACTCIFIVLFVASCSKKPATQPVVVNKGDTSKSTPGFTISGSKILDPAGNEFIAKGINVNGPYWPWTRPTLPDVSLIADIWKFNTVRVDTWPEFSIYNNNNTDLPAIVKAFTDKKVVVIIEDHNFTGRFPNTAELDTLTNWWVGIANTYKTNPYVWFNIMNEPGNSAPAPQAWLNTHDAVIKAIRNTGSNNIIVCDDSAYGQANGYDANSSSSIITYGPTLAASYKNILFSLHSYSEWTYADDRLKTFINTVQSKKLAMIIGEYGTADDVSMEVATSVFKDAIPLNVGRIGWQWCGVDTHKLVATGEGGGFDIDNTSGAKPTNLSFVGNLIWDDNHAGINLSSPEIIPPAVIIFNTGFEEGSPVSGASLGNDWISFGTSIYDSAPQNLNSGSFSAEVPAGAAGGFGHPIYLQPGATYQLTAWGKNSITPSIASNIGINYQTSLTGASTTITALNFSQSGAQQLSVTFTVPANLVSLYLFAYKNDPNTVFWVDDVSISKM